MKCSFGRGEMMRTHAGINLLLLCARSMNNGLQMSERGEDGHFLTPSYAQAAAEDKDLDGISKVGGEYLHKLRMKVLVRRLPWE